MKLGVSQEKTVVFVGEKSSGKSSLIAKFLDEPVKDDMKETTALDFRYGTRIKDEKKQKVNIYELGMAIAFTIIFPSTNLIQSKLILISFIYRWWPHFITFACCSTDSIQHLKYSSVHCFRFINARWGHRLSALLDCCGEGTFAKSY